jgi:NAD(P)H-hydrate repair Nnr-like enzyme with NAD(P)H-hydrate dehydratase domain
MFGDRYWLDEGPIDAVLDMLVHKYTRGRLLIIEGKAPGADSIAGELAKAKGVHVAEVEALWDFLHKSAGPQRNEAMACALNPHFGFAFHENIENSSGTAGTGRLMGQLNKKVWLHDGKALKEWYS